jgi:hypothetical protein
MGDERLKGKEKWLESKRKRNQEQKEKKNTYIYIERSFKK